VRILTSVCMVLCIVLICTSAVCGWNMYLDDFSSNPSRLSDDLLPLDSHCRAEFAISGTLYSDGGWPIGEEITIWAALYHGYPRTEGAKAICTVVVDAQAKADWKISFSAPSVLLGGEYLETSGGSGPDESLYINWWAVDASGDHHTGYDTWGWWQAITRDCCGGTDCDVIAIASSPTDYSAHGGTGTIDVAAPDGCSWEPYTSDDDWIIIESPPIGEGNGTVYYHIERNDEEARNGAITIEGKLISITQAAGGSSCSYGLGDDEKSFGYLGGDDDFMVTTGTSCGWEASTESTWIDIRTRGTQEGSKTFRYRVLENEDAARTGYITIEHCTFTVHQDAAPGCEDEPSVVDPVQTAGDSDTNATPVGDVQPASPPSTRVRLTSTSFGARPAYLSASTQTTDVPDYEFSYLIFDFRDMNEEAKAWEDRNSTPLDILATSVGITTDPARRAALKVRLKGYVQLHSGIIEIGIWPIHYTCSGELRLKLERRCNGVPSGDNTFYAVDVEIGDGGPVDYDWSILRWNPLVCALTGGLSEFIPAGGQYHFNPYSEPYYIDQEFEFSLPACTEDAEQTIIASLALEVSADVTPHAGEARDSASILGDVLDIAAIAESLKLLADLGSDAASNLASVLKALFFTGGSAWISASFELDELVIELAE